MSDVKKWDCTLLRRITSVSNGDPKHFVDVWHNISLPFIPFEGLRVEYLDECFDQGCAFGVVQVSEFSCDKIKTVSWDISAERFLCYEKNVFVNDKDFKGYVLGLIEEQNWFLEDFERFVFDFVDPGYFDIIKLKRFFEDDYIA